MYDSNASVSLAECVSSASFSSGFFAKRWYSSSPWPRELVLSRVFQAYEQGNYLPPTTNSLPHLMVNMGEKIERLEKVLLLIAFGADFKKILIAHHQKTQLE